MQIVKSFFLIIPIILNCAATVQASPNEEIIKNLETQDQAVKENYQNLLHGIYQLWAYFLASFEDYQKVRQYTAENITLSTIKIQELNAGSAQLSQNINPQASSYALDLALLTNLGEAIKREQESLKASTADLRTLQAGWIERCSNERIAKLSTHFNPELLFGIDHIDIVKIAERPFEVQVSVQISPDSGVTGIQGTGGVVSGENGTITTASSILGMGIGQIASGGLSALGTALTAGGAFGGLIGAGAGVAIVLVKDMLFGENVSALMNRQYGLLESIRESQKTALINERKNSPELIKQICLDATPTDFLESIRESLTIAENQENFAEQSLSQHNSRLQLAITKFQLRLSDLERRIMPLLAQTYLDQMDKIYKETAALNAKIEVQVSRDIQPKVRELKKQSSEKVLPSIKAQHTLWDEVIRSDAQYHYG